MFWLKSCPHCRGDLYEGKDIYGRYVACLQCGHYLGEAEKPFLRYLPQWEAEARSGQGAGEEQTFVPFLWAIRPYWCWPAPNKVIA